ncbi:MAG: YfcE family phosphodiesterase [Clostridia bacterium]|nr:YfcE family phosphodiesterase [Clostridia bacterium]
MRALIFSDTHGDISLCEKAITALAPIDMIIHLGDSVFDAAAIAKSHRDIECCRVCGNCDGAAGKMKAVVDVGDWKIFICHGHLHSEAELVSEAKKNGCFAALCGHTHIKSDKVVDGVRIVNPGSASRPRDAARSFAIFETSGRQGADFVLVDWM